MKWLWKPKVDNGQNFSYNVCMITLFSKLFGCPHARQTRPFTLDNQSYKVCLDCAQHIPYSVTEFRPLTAREVRAEHTTFDPDEAVA